MKIALNKPEGISGGNTFLKRLVKYFEKKNHKISYVLDENQDIFLINGFVDPKNIPKNVKIVQRIDGVNFNLSKENVCSSDTNEKLSKIHSIADGVIYQSEFSKIMCEKYLTEYKINSKKTIIFNGANKNTYNNEFDKFGYKHMILTAGKWRPHKRLKDVIKGFLKLNRSDTCLVVIGPTYVGKEEKIKKSNIFYLGELDNKEMPRYYNAADIFVFLPWFDWCPNVVVEALISGTPVICTNQGGTKELVKDSGIILETDPEYNLDPCYVYDPPEVPSNKIADAINEILENKNMYKVEREDLHIDNIGKKYEDFFEKVLFN